MPQKGRDWSNLPSDLLQIIADFLTDIADISRFRSVCVSWRSAKISVAHPPQLPWLLFPPNPYANRDEPRHFFSLNKNRVLPLQLPCDCHTIGSPNGLVILAVDGNRSLSLLNPLTGTRLVLPPITDPFLENTHFDIRRCKVHNFAENYVVMVSFWCGSILRFYESWEKKWKCIVVDIDLEPDDFTFHNGCLYVFREDGAIRVIDPCSLNQAFLVPSVGMGKSYRRYLVETTHGDLLLVVRPSADNDNNKFKVFQLNWKNKERPKWSRAWNIGDNMLFVDDTHAMCFLARSFKGFRENCIYFTGVYRVCLYNIYEGRVEQLPCYWENFPYPKELHDAVWFVPELCWNGDASFCLAPQPHMSAPPWLPPYPA